MYTQTVRERERGEKRDMVTICYRRRIKRKTCLKREKKTGEGGAEIEGCR